MVSKRLSYGKGQKDLQFFLYNAIYLETENSMQFSNVSKKTRKNCVENPNVTVKPLIDNMQSSLRMAQNICVDLSRLFVNLCFVCEE